MSLRMLSRVAGPAAMAALTVAAGIAPSQASSAGGWHVAAVTPTPPADDTVLFSVAATGPSNAWTAGVDCTAPCGTTSSPAVGPLLVEQWNGTAWAATSQPLPAALTTVEQSSVGIGSSSASDAWVFASDANGNPLGASWNGAQWTQATLPAWFFPATGGVASVSQYKVEDFGPDNVWVFNLEGGVRYAAHYSNGAWAQVHMPASAWAVSATSPKDMWAVGLAGQGFARVRAPRAGAAANAARDLAAAARAGRSKSKIREVALRWNGRKWAAVRMPSPYVTKSRVFLPLAAAALGARSVWANGVVLNVKHGSFVASRLLRWNGRRWTSVNVPLRAYDFFGAMTGDGKGGLWMSMLGGSAGADYLVHYSHKRWTATRPPKQSHVRPVAIALASVPGTTGEWAVGATSVGATSLGVILKHGR